MQTVDITDQSDPSDPSQQATGSRLDQVQSVPAVPRSITKREVPAPAPAPAPVPSVSFSYILPASTKYNILLDQTANMEVNMRWTNIKRALFRFVIFVNLLKIIIILGASNIH